MDWFLVRKLLTALVLPPIGPLLVAFLGLALLGRMPRLGRVLAWLGFVGLLLLSLPIVAHGLALLIEDSPPLDFAQTGDARAIVILGGGVRRDAPEYGGDTLGRLTLERVRYGSLVARKVPLPVLVTGGAPFARGKSEAGLMKKALEDEFGVAVRWAEAKSRNTHENAVESAAILRKEGIHRVILVAHGFDMRRARLEFAAVGVEVVPAPTGLAGVAFDGLSDLVPGLGALQDSYYALYELLANAVLLVGIPNSR